MSYAFIDGYGSVLTSESSIVSGGAQRQAVAIASFLTAVPTTPTGNQSVSGTVQLINSSVSGVGLFNVNHIGNGSVQAVLLNSSVSGVGLFNVNHVGNGSVQAVLLNSSVATLQGTNPWVIGNSSVMLTPGINTIGSVATLQGTTPWITTIQNNSIAGTYAEDAAHASGERGIFVLGVRNDTVASFVSANGDYGPIGTDSQGRVLVKAAPEEARIQSVIATNNTTATSLLAAGGAGLRTYVTDAFVTNTGGTATLVSFLDGDNSVIGRTIAPATGGSNLVNIATPMRTGGFNQIVQITVATAVSTIGVTALGYKAP